jgi:hypothetical protein
MQDHSAAGCSLMRQEIGQQPAALRATIDALLPRRDEVAALGAQTRAVLFIARGTSDNAAVYGSYLIQAHAGWLRRRSRRPIRHESTCPGCLLSRCPSLVGPKRSLRR